MSIRFYLFFFSSFDFTAYFQDLSRILLVAESLISLNTHVAADFL